ncbi:MAG: aspartate-semialdehyde dehydrogenase [Actinomycetota bacterium]|nr:aspartate-semialdehyde dehydrogenase [Actinomycetota bacterium]
MTRVGLVGATGLVGRTMLVILAERQFPVDDLRVFASPRSAGTKLETAWGEVEVEDLAEADPRGLQLGLFSAGAQRSRQHAPRFVERGAVVIDNSSAFRMDPQVPLVVAGVNDADLDRHRGIVANPNCTTMDLAVAVAPLHERAGLRSVVASSYQSVSGSGQRAVDELVRQVEALGAERQALASGAWSDPGCEVYSRPIGWNVIPFAGQPGEGGHTEEEWKLVNETRKILGVSDLAVEATCVRVPVMVGHGVATSLWFDRPLGVEEASQVLRQAPGVELWEEVVPTPLDAAGRDEVLVGRLRQTLGTPGGLSMWVVGDNLRKGAALNAVQLAELLANG